MATVTGFTAARMLAIENASVVSGAINGSGHLILTTHSGSTIDAGNALVAIPEEAVNHWPSATYYNSTTPAIDYPLGVSYLWLSDTETTADWTTFAGKWGSLRTVRFSNNDAEQTFTRLAGSGTPPEQWMRSGNVPFGWMAWSKLANGDEAVRVNSGIAENATPSSYPTNFSIMSVTSWSVGSGTVATVNISTDRCEQTLYSNTGGTDTPKSWIRTHHTSNGGGGWTPWRQVATTADDIVFPSTTPTAATWYRVATFTSGSGGINPSPKASAEFVISTTGTGLSSFIRLRASVALKASDGASLLVDECSGYGAVPMFTKARIISLNGTTDGHALELYCGATATGAKLKIHVKHDDWLQTTPELVNRWGSIGIASSPSTPTAPESVLIQRGIGYTGGPIAPTMLNSWVWIGLGVYGVPTYQMMPGGIVQLSGVLKKTSGSIDSSGNTPCFILPEGMRPISEKIYPGLTGSNTIGRVDVFPDGKVSAIVGDTSTVTLDGISFAAYQ